jgi:hypothetical protein
VVELLKTTFWKMIMSGGHLMVRKGVILLPSPDMTTHQGWSAQKRKRRTLWQHAARNQFVSEVAKACLKQEKKKLKELGIPCRNKKKGVWTHRVVILVENTLHAHALGELLPAWEVLDTVPAQEPMDEEGEEKEGIPLTSGSIITWMYALRKGIDADYLIRATGWRGKIDLRGADIRLKHSRRGLILVDFEDSWDLQASMDTEARVQEYKEQGLEVMENKESFTKK